MGINKEDGYSKEGKRAVAEHKRQSSIRYASESAIDAELAVEELDALLRAGQGYLRVGWKVGQGFWVRWKWTDGPLAGRYVFARCDTLRMAIQEVCLNASEVREGKRVASLDRRL